MPDLRHSHRLLGPLLVLALCLPAAAVARRGGDGGGDRPEVRVGGACGEGATARLRLRGRDGTIRIQLEVHGRRNGERWRIVLTHERRVAWRGTARTHAPSGWLEVERRVADYAGGDLVAARAAGPRGVVCQAAAVLPG
jgi:hypothetical protein